MMQRNAPPLILCGTSISPGMAEGTIHVHRIEAGLLDVPQSESMDVDDEISRLDTASLKIAFELQSLAGHVEQAIDTRLAQVFGVHQLILRDSSLREELIREIKGNVVSASRAVKTVFLRWENRFRLMESHFAREKGDDMRDVANRLCNALAGITIHPLEEIPERCVLATTRLLPSDVVFLSERSTVAILLEFCSFGSHAALFVREMGLPCIAGFADLEMTIPDGAHALVDAEHGSVTVHPSAGQRSRFRQQVSRRSESYRLAAELARLPAYTKDHTAVRVLANVGSAADTQTAVKNGAEGIGLYRLEHIYIGCLEPPSTESVYQQILHTLLPAKGMPVCVRLLDIGADKPFPFLRFLAESNPALGRRGVRLLMEYPEILDTQLRTILRLAKEFDCSILVPMVTVADDIEAVRMRLRSTASEMGIDCLPMLGAMIETPAAALSASNIAKYSDFLSFGTNDLTQYAFAADRENAAVERYFDDADEVIFRLMTITHNDVPAMPLSLCGELAGKPNEISRILACGIRTLSVAPPLVPIIKEAIRSSFCEPQIAKAPFPGVSP